MSKRRLVMVAEHGSFEREEYWRLELDGTTRALRVSVPGVADEERILEAPVVDSFFADAARFKIFALPSTDYSVDHSDDLYHRGVSVEVHDDTRHFVHRVRWRESGAFFVTHVADLRGRRRCRRAFW